MNSFNTLSAINVGEKNFNYHSLIALGKNSGLQVSTLPFSTRILLENLLRHEDGEAVTKADILALLNQDQKKESTYEIQFTPSRVLLQDFTGVPVVADLAAMRDAMKASGGDVQKINPLRPVDLVIDHSVQMDSWGQKDSAAINTKFEFERNSERYKFLKWGQKAFKSFNVVPPATGICHQVNLEYLSHVAIVGDWQGTKFIYPDSLVGTDSHTTMINGLGVLGWGVGGIEAEAAMLGQPCTMLIPQVVGFEFTGQLPVGATATDLVLTVTQMLRKKGVVGKFVEYFGEGVKNLTIADRATVANMSPEYGATIGIFPIDERVIAYLKSTGRTERAQRTEIYFKAQGLWKTDQVKINYSEIMQLDLATVQPSMAGPSRPQDRVALADVRSTFRNFLLKRYDQSLNQFSKEKLAEWLQMSESMKGISYEMEIFHPDADLGVLTAAAPVTLPTGEKFNLVHGSIVIAAITSCTNTSNPALMLGAAVLARNAVKKGLTRKPWVKTTFAPGSLTVRDYIEAAGLMSGLESLGFNIAGFGCAVCIGNSGPLPNEIQAAIDEKHIATAAVLSGNRNFEARIHSSVMTNWLASPLLVVASAIAGNINVNLVSDPLGVDGDKKPIYLKDIWPDPQEVADLISKFVTQARFEKVYSDVLTGDTNWQQIEIPSGDTYGWSSDSTYIQSPPFLDSKITSQNLVIKKARLLAVFGDSITTDHISPAGSIPADSPAGSYLSSKGIKVHDFNSYGSRRGNHNVMIRGTFANVRIRNKLIDQEGGWTRIFPANQKATIYDAAMTYATQNTPLVIVAGKEYGSGSSRDWAAKGTRLLGVRAVVAESFERIHRSNLVGMGVLPLQLINNETVESLDLTGPEEIDFPELTNLKPKMQLTLKITLNGVSRDLQVMVRIDTPNELKYFLSGGILPYVMNRLKNP